MEKGIYKDKVIRDYLLGALSEDETERLDELSVTDDEFAARLQAIENDLVDSYTRGELSGESLERFRSHYLSSPRRREKVAFAEELGKLTDRIALTETAEKKIPIFSQPSSTARLDEKKVSTRRFFSFPRAVLQWGLAAAVLLILASGGWLVFDNLRLQNQVNHARAEREALEKREQELQSQLDKQHSLDSEKEQELAGLRERLAELEQRPTEASRDGSQSPSIQQEPNIIAFALSPQLRSAGQIAILTVPSDADLIAIELELEPNDFAWYRAELKSQSEGQIVWKSGRSRARMKGDSKAVTVSLRSTLLRSQMYVIEITGISSSGDAEIIGSYPFRVIKD